MAQKTRGHQDLNTLRVVIGASKQLPQTYIPSLRDILAAGLYIKETSITHAKKINILARACGVQAVGVQAVDCWQ